jgi:hypothetical protein
LKDIENTRKESFLAMNNERWSRGSDFMENFKITLAQVFADDDTDIDEHKVKIMCERAYRLCTSSFSLGTASSLFGDKAIKFSF